MTQSQLFLLLFVTVLMTVSGTRAIIHREFGFGIILIAIPICGWASIWMTP